MDRLRGFDRLYNFSSTGVFNHLDRYRHGAYGATTYQAKELSPGTYYAFCVAPTNSTAESAVAYVDPTTLDPVPTIAGILVDGNSTPAPIAGTTTHLTADAAGSGPTSQLTFAWSVGASETGETAMFSVNNCNAAEDTTVTFYAAGDYNLVLTVTDAQGAAAYKAVDVTVQQTPSGITVTPANVALAESQTQQFSAVEVDQFGNNMYPQPASFTWSAGGAAASFPTPATGDGSYPTPPPGIAITSGGLYTAPPVGDATGTVTVHGGRDFRLSQCRRRGRCRGVRAGQQRHSADPETLDETKIFTDTGAPAGTIPTLNPPGVTLCGAADINLGDGTHLDASGASIVRENAGRTVIQTYITITNSSYLPWTGMVLNPSGTSFWACDASCYVYEFSIATGAKERGFLASGDLGELASSRFPHFSDLTVDDHNNTTNSVTAIDGAVPVLYVPENPRLKRLTSTSAFLRPMPAPGKIVSLTVERSDGLWTASTGFTTSGGTLDEVLPVTNTPAEFVVKATLNTGTSTEPWKLMSTSSSRGRTWAPGPRPGRPRPGQRRRGLAVGLGPGHYGRRRQQRLGIRQCQNHQARHDG